MSGKERRIMYKIDFNSLSRDELIEWGQKHLGRYEAKPIMWKGKKILLCLTDQLVSDELYDRVLNCYEWLGETAKVSTESIEEDIGYTVTPIEEKILELFEEVTGVEIIYCFNEY